MALPAQSDPTVGDLARFDEDWTKAAAPSDGSHPDVPDGIYDAVIEDAQLTETVSTGRPIVVWKLRIRGPQAVDRVVTKNRVITENTLQYLREDLDKCRLAVARLSELPARLGELVGRPIGIEKRTKDGRSNIYFRWQQANRTDQGIITDDDVPF
ncbi:MAG TPA: DUF669 domain-containing protein [Bryobacteraceae bacterium]|jgi:hypothetical protein